MARPKLPEQPWYRQAAEIMVRQGVGIRSAVTELHIDIDGTDCDKVYKSTVFQDILWQERNRYQTEVAETPGRSKSAVIGLAVIAIQRLCDAGEWDKVLTGIEKLAKIEGWMGADTNITVFGGLTARDIASEKEKLIKLAGLEPKSADVKAPKLLSPGPIGDN